MEKPNIKRVTGLSWIRKQAKEDFEMLKKEPELDPSFFTDDELEHYVDFLLRVHADEWLVIDDTNNNENYV